MAHEAPTHISLWFWLRHDCKSTQQHFLATVPLLCTTLLSSCMVAEHIEMLKSNPRFICQSLAQGFLASSASQCIRDMLLPLATM